MSIQRHDFRFLDPLRVRWAEVDVQNIVFNGHYLMYFDTAVAGYWRAMALPYHATMHALGGDLFVRKATVEYLASAAYDDALNVGVRLTRIGTSSMTLQCAVFKRDQALVHGELVYVYADPATQTSRPVPQALRDTLQGFEAGLPMLVAKHGTHAVMQTDVAQVLASLGADDAAILAAASGAGPGQSTTHVVLKNRMGAAVASACVHGGTKDATLSALVVVPALRQSAALGELVCEAAAAAKALGAQHLNVRVPLGLADTMKRVGFVAQGVDERSAQLSLALP
jgi:YbgC/YbaW family acyl-CoA thioester hydrolase